MGQVGAALPVWCEDAAAALVVLLVLLELELLQAYASCKGC